MYAIHEAIQRPLPYPTRWVRSRDGLVSGVCEGLARRFGLDPWLVRVAWIAAMAIFGVGLLFYVILAIALPREDRVTAALDKRLLGVCARLSRISGLEVGLVRALALMLSLASFGLTVLAYLVLYFVLPRSLSGDRYLSV